MKLRKFTGKPALFHLLNLQVTDWLNMNQKSSVMVSFLCGMIISTPTMSNTNVSKNWISWKCWGFRLSFLRQAAILTIISFKVFFSKIKKCVTYLLRAIFNIDLHFLKTPSKSCFCYLVKFVKILYVLILFIFLKKLGSCIKMKPMTVNLNTMRKRWTIVNWPVAGQAHLRPDI